MALDYYATLANSGFRWGQDISSPGNWDQSQVIQSLMALQGQKVGTPRVDENGIRFVDTPWGPVMSANDHFAGFDPDSAMAREANGPLYYATGARHVNEHGSDAVRAKINDQGILEYVGMDRESNATQNMALAAIFGLPLAGLAAGAGYGGMTGITAGTGATPGTAGAVLSAAGNGVGAGAVGAGGLGTAGMTAAGNAAADELFAAETFQGSQAMSAANGGSWMDTISNAFKPGGGGMSALSGLFGSGTDLLKNAGSLALMYKMYEDQKGNAQEWRDFMGASTPDKGMYEGKLRESYENPGAWLNGPEYQAAQAVTHNKLQRSDAAGGRLANDFGRQQQLQDHAMGALQGYQKNLGGLVTDQQRISTGQASNALENAQAAEGDWMKNLMNWMNSQGK